MGQSDARKGTGKNEASWLVVAFNQASVMRPSLTCPVCLDLTPNHLSTTRWQFKVTENLLIECALHFAFSELEVSCLSCAVCAVIKNGIEMMSRGELRDELEGLSEREGCFIVQKNSPLEVEVFDEDGDEDEAVRMQFYVEEGNGNPDCLVFGTANDIAPSISQKSHCPLIQSWITSCLQDHAACTQGPGRVLPTRLLDISPRLDSSVVLVETRHLPISSGPLVYSTLSHCWGITEFIKTTLSSVKTFQAGIEFTALPRTFQDAISIARELDIKYIWIDTLCIIQDSSDDWKHESALMASVYSNSYLNIAATGSSDSSQSFLSSRNLTHNSVKIPSASSIKDGNIVSVRASLSRVHKLYSTPSKTINWSSHGNEDIEAPLLSRAWVFQERHLAPRTLHFCPSELVMECRAGLRCECTGLDTFVTNPLRNFDDLSFTSWFGVVEEFSRLRLTYQSDRLQALNGVAEVFREKLGCEYLSGVWGGDVAKGLLWNFTRYESYNPSSSSSSATKRQGKDVAPTWSWASMVLADGNRIFFAAGDDESFVADEEFGFLFTKPLLKSTESDLGSGSGAICVKSAFASAIACSAAGIDGQKQGVLLIFDTDIDDMVLITTIHMKMDDSPDFEKSNTSREVSCLLVGSTIEKDWDTDQQTRCFCMLVLQPSLEIPGAWERIGILDVKEDVGIHRDLEEKRFKLV